VIDETADYIAICRLQSAYADAVNRRAWLDLAALFLPDAHVVVDTVTNPVIETDGGDGIAGFIEGAIERFEFFEFIRLNTVVSFDDDSHARARLFMCELRQHRETHEFSRAFGVYHDHYAKADGVWRFGDRRYQSLARPETGEVFPFPAEFD
jgi:hypothetical protein